GKFDFHVTPGRVIIWTAPAAIQPDERTVCKRDHENSGSIDDQSRRRKQRPSGLIGLGVDFSNLALEYPAQHIHHMDGVVHHSAAARKPWIDKPIAVIARIFALIGRVATVDFA